MKKLGLTTASLGVAVLTFGIGPAEAAPAWTKKVKTEKCYGVAQAGQNDCGSYDGSHGCTGYATESNHPGEWLHVPKGLCKRIGGKLTGSKKKK